MTHEELEEKIRELVTQWGAVHPDYELMVISLPKNNPKERNRILKGIAEILGR